MTEPSSGRDGDPEAIRAAVEALVEGHRGSAGTIGALPGGGDGYAVQAEVVRGLAELWHSEPCGYKLGLTLSDPPPSGLASAPAHGTLLTAHLYPDGSTIPLAGAPLLEAELLVRARTDLRPNMSDGQLIAATEVSAMLEVPVSRFRDWWPAGEAPRLSRAEFIADNCLARYVVTPARWLSAEGRLAATVSVEVTAPDGAVTRGSGRSVMGDPLHALRWLLEQIGVLPAGRVVATGTMIPALRVVAGTYRAHFSDSLGSVSVTFGSDTETSCSAE